MQKNKLIHNKKIGRTLLRSHCYDRENVLNDHGHLLDNRGVQY